MTRCPHPRFLALILLGVALDIRPGLCDGNILRHAWTRPGGGGAIAVRQDGTIILAGATTDPPYRESDVYVMERLEEGGDGWVYKVGGSGNDSATGVAIAANGDILFSGWFEETVDFDPGPGLDEHSAYGYNAFVTRLSSMGVYLWTKSLDGPGSASGADIALDVDGNILITGSFGGQMDFDPGPAMDLRTAGTFGDMFVTKLRDDGTYLWTRTVGGSRYVDGNSLGVDSAGSVYAAGSFSGRADFDPGPGTDFHTTVLFRDNVYATKLFSDGSYAWTRTYPTNLFGFTVTPEGSVFFTGGHKGATIDFDPTEGVDFRTPADRDAFVTKLNPDGSYGWTYTATNGASGGEALAVDADGAIMVRGSVYDSPVDFDPGSDVVAYACPSKGGQVSCEFLLKLNAEGSFNWLRTTEDSFESPFHLMTFDDQGNLYYTRFLGVSDADPTCAVVDIQPPDPDVEHVLYLTKLTCGDLPADFDANGLVDLADLAAFQNCFEGQESDTCSPGCDIFDLSPDNALDLADFAAFGDLLTSP